MTEAIERAAAALASADALVVTAGAGMGVDSGLPDFRGSEGFWQAYPPFRKIGLHFEDLANPSWFERDPQLAWGFYGHRLALYRSTAPHEGFRVLLRWAERMAHGAFVFTTNVDGHFAKAGFPAERIVEHHGAIERLQCTADCGEGIFPAPGWEVEVDPATFRARGRLPSCPSCGALARPNILMFDDAGWDPTPTLAQRHRLDSWLAGLQDAKLVVVECGAGKAIPSARIFGESLVRNTGGRLIRINVRESGVPGGAIGLAMGAREALLALDRRIR